MAFLHRLPDRFYQLVPLCGGIMKKDNKNQCCCKIIEEAYEEILYYVLFIMFLCV